MVKKASRDIIGAHSLSATVRALEEACLAGDLGPEDFLRRADEELARLRTLLDAGPAPLDGAAGAAGAAGAVTAEAPGWPDVPDAPAMAGLEEDAASRYVASGTEVVRAQTRELDNFKQRLAEELAGIRTAYAEDRVLPEPSADGFPPIPGDGAFAEPEGPDAPVAPDTPGPDFTLEPEFAPEGPEREYILVPEPDYEPEQEQELDFILEPRPAPPRPAREPQAAPLPGQGGEPGPEADFTLRQHAWFAEEELRETGAADEDAPLDLGPPVAAPVAPVAPVAADAAEAPPRATRRLGMLYSVDLPETPPPGLRPGRPGALRSTPPDGVPALGRREAAAPETPRAPVSPPPSLPETSAAPDAGAPQGILRALRHAAAAPTEPDTDAFVEDTEDMESMGPGASVPFPRRGVVSVDDFPAPDDSGAEDTGVPDLRRAARAQAAPSAPARLVAPGAGAVQAPRDSRPAEPARPQAVPGRSRVVVSGCAAWETTDNDMALSMFVPGSQMDMARPASTADQILGAVGRSPEGEAARQRLARMTREDRLPRKSPGGAAAISLFMAGAGLLYTGNMALGAVLSLVHVACAALVFLTQSPLAVGGMGAASLLGAWLAWREAREQNACELARREAERQGPTLGGARETCLSGRDLRL
jgi:hypothetical protein